jgi:acyl-CoA synthetase (NDP forming)
VPDLAVLCTNAKRNLPLLEELVRRAVKPALFFLPPLSNTPNC